MLDAFDASLRAAVSAARVGTGAHCATSLELTSISVEDLKRQVAGSLFKVAADGSLLLVPTRAATRVLRPSAAASGTPTGPPAPSASAIERLEVHVRSTPVGRPVGHVVPGAYRTLEDLAASCSHIAWGGVPCVVATMCLAVAVLYGHNNLCPYPRLLW